MITGSELDYEWKSHYGKRFYARADGVHAFTRFEFHCQDAEAHPKEIGRRVSGEPLSSNAVSRRAERQNEEDSNVEPHGVEARYRALVEQIPAVVFMAYLDKGIGEAYVSPQIEAALGFSQDEWLEDPVRWYQPDLSRTINSAGAPRPPRCFFRANR